MKNEKLDCLNCRFSLSEKNTYCPNCGQEAKFNNLSFKHMVGSFFESIFNLDTKIVRSLKDIWIPNKITNYFIEGRRTKYMHPFRFFFISLIVFFGLLSFATKRISINELHEFNEAATNYKIQKRFDTVKDSIQTLCAPNVMESLEAKLFRKNYIGDTSLFINGTLLGIDFGKIGLTKEDAISLSPAEIYNKYKITSKFEKYVIAQLLRVANNLESALKTIIMNMLWAIIVLTILAAFFLWLLYFRHSSFFVESMIHMIHFHTFCMILASIYLIYLYIFNNYLGVPIFIFLSLLSTTYLLMCLKNYYNQGYMKTLFKILILFILYNFTGLMLIGLIGIFSAAIF